MQTTGLFNFPLPMLTAVLCGVIAVHVWRLDLGARRASRTLSAVFALASVQALLVGLRFGYGSAEVLALQRTLPLLAGPLIFLGFAALRFDGQRLRRRVAGHLGAPLLVTLLMAIGVIDLRLSDALISTSYLFYILCLALLWREGPDALIHARIDRARELSRWMLFSIGVLAFVFLLDTTIAVDFALNAGANVATFISYGSLPLILVLIAILLAVPRISEGAKQARRNKAGGPQVADIDIEARLAALLSAEQLFLDPNLTLQRLARRLHLPARSVSAAVNETKGINVSQYVNAYRVDYAASLLKHGTQSVKDVAAASGFLTRSNFYREFQRIHGMAPGDYRNVWAAGQQDASC